MCTNTPTPYRTPTRTLTRTRTATPTSAHCTLRVMCTLTPTPYKSPTRTPTRTPSRTPSPTNNHCVLRDMCTETPTPFMTATPTLTPTSTSQYCTLREACTNTPTPYRTVTPTPTRNFCIIEPTPEPTICEGAGCASSGGESTDVTQFALCIPTSTPTPTRTPSPTATATLTPNCGVVPTSYGNVFIRSDPSATTTTNILGTFFYENRTNNAGVSYLYVNPPERRFTPIGQVEGVDGYTWVLIHHNPHINNGTQGWMRQNSLDLSACGGITALPNINASMVGLGPNGLSTITDINAPIPSLSEMWLPFGDCQGYADNQDRRRCSFDVLATLQADGGIRVRDILAIALMYEMGSVLTNYRDIPANQLEANLSTGAKYHLEAMTRNFTAFCMNSNSSANCNLQNVLNWVLGIQGWYDQYGKTANDIKNDRGTGNNTSNFGEFTPYMFSKSAWLSGLQTNKPFTWGNWTQGQSSYSAISTIIDNNGNPFTCTPATMTCPTSALFYAERFSPPQVPCHYVFAVTISNHGYGQTSACSAGRFTDFATPILPFPNRHD